jgi:hypothetical protein
MTLLSRIDKTIESPIWEVWYPFQGVVLYESTNYGRKDFQIPRTRIKITFLETSKASVDAGKPQ